MLILILILAISPFIHAQTATTQVVGSEVKVLPSGAGSEPDATPSVAPASSAPSEKLEPELPIDSNSTLESTPKEKNETVPALESDQQSLNFSEALGNVAEKPKLDGGLELEPNSTLALEPSGENLNSSAALKPDEAGDAKKLEEAKKPEEAKAAEGDEGKKPEEVKTAEESKKPEETKPADDAKKSDDQKLELESTAGEISASNSSLTSNETVASSETEPPKNTSLLTELANERSKIASSPSLIVVAEAIPENLLNANANVSEDSANSTENSSKFLLPSKIDHLRTTIIGFTGKPVHTFNLTDNQILYQTKIFWGEPDSWQDIGYPPTDRIFELFCWLNVNGGFGRDLVRANLSASLISHSQWFAFPEAEDEEIKNISVNCGIRPFNAAGKSGDWTFSDPASVRESPIFLRGFENVNVKGWTKEEVVRLIRNQKRLDTPQPLAQKAAKSRVAKNRKAT